VLVQNASAAFGVELSNFSLQLFIDKQQRFQRTHDIAVATGHDFVNGRFIRFGTHRISSNCPDGISLGVRSAFLWIVGIEQAATASMVCAHRMANVRVALI
jgi:hypothetical protein